MKIRFGVRLPVSGPLASAPAIAKVAKLAEELGYDSLWLHDHVLWTRKTHAHHISSGSAAAVKQKQDPVMFESLTTLSYLCATTRRAMLGVACMVLPCRNPVYLAKQAANIDVLSNGRLILGVGLGSKATMLAKEFEVFAVPETNRSQRMKEYVNAVKSVWTQPRARFSGKYVSFSGAEIYPKPVQKPHPPIWIGGWSKGSVRRTAEVGDGWIPGWLTPSEMAENVAQLQELAQKFRRNPRKITVAVEKYLCLSKDRKNAVTKALDTIRQSRETYERAVDDLNMAKEAHVFGNPEDVNAQVGRFVDAGVTHFEFKFIYSTVGELMDMMEFFRDSVMSNYR